jgi:hypothetical protein
MRPKEQQITDERNVLGAANAQLLAALEVSLAGVRDDQILFVAPALDERPLRDVVIHAYRPVLAAAAVIAGHPWPPRPDPPRSIAELQSLLADMASQINQWLAEIPTQAFTQSITLRWGKYETGIEAIVESIAHGLVHAGVIYGIRAAGGFPVPPEASSET